MKILTFDIGGTNIKYALCNEKFELTDKKSIPTEAAKGGQHIINKIIDIIEEFNDLDRVAISTAGQVDSENGIVVYSTDNIPYYTGMMVKKLIETKTGVKTYAENDVNASATALVNAVEKETGKRLNGFEIFSEENFENPEIRYIIDSWIDEIILGLKSIIYIFNPSLIVLGGGIMNENYIIDLIDRKIYKQLMESFRNVNIVSSKTGNDAGLLGAAYMASQM